MFHAAKSDFSLVFYVADGMVGGGFYLNVDNGDSPGCKNRINTRVVLVCNSTAHWTAQNLTSIAHVSQQGCQVSI